MIRETKSICPVCLKTIPAQYIERENNIYLMKDCDDHGSFSCLICREADVFHAWHKDTVNIAPREPLTTHGKGCPHDCGPCEEHLQTACCVLLDVTDRCNQACPICFASAGQNEIKDIPLSQIEMQLDKLSSLSEDRKFNIQLSGGEPTVRDDLCNIIRMAKAKGFEYVQLNTNGKKIGQSVQYAVSLAEAGLDAVFLQFDGTDDHIYETLRGEKLLSLKKAAVGNCRIAGLPVALVPTVVKGVNDQNMGELVRYMLDNLDVVKGIHFQPVSLFGRYPAGLADDSRITLFDIISGLEVQTKGIIKKEALAPLATGHNLCCFYGTFLRGQDGTIEAIGGPSEKNACSEPAASQSACCGENTQSACCDPSSQETCCLPDIEIIKKDRDYVRNRWKLAGALTEDADGFDLMIDHLRRNSFTLSGMAFQDALNFDVERVSRCRVQVFSQEEKLIPFCAYNLTNTEGHYLYRK